MCDVCEYDYKIPQFIGRGIRKQISEKGSITHNIVKNADTFLNVAREFAKISKYEGTKVGCVLVKDGLMISHGVNGYPVGVDDNYINSMDREDRLKLAIHAEENAILKLLEFGISAKGATAFVTHHPCIGCASRLYSIGIKKVVYPKQDEEFIERWIKPVDHLYKKLTGMQLIEVDA